MDCRTALTHTRKPLDALPSHMERLLLYSVDLTSDLCEEAATLTFTDTFGT